MERRVAVEGEGIMGLSRFGLTGRVISGCVAAALLAGVSLQADAYGNKGVIKLALGQAAPFQDGFYFFAFDRQTEKYVYTGDFQKFSLTQKCIVNTGSWVNDNQPDGPKDLVSLKAIGPLGSNNPRAGLVDGSLGVYDNSKGVSCSRMTASIFEGLEIDSLVGGFDRLELDMELKGNAKFRLTIDPGSADPHVYYLYSGTSRSTDSDVLSLDSNGLPSATPLSPGRNCAGSSDSGPDSGPSDNCRWVIDDVGSSFRIEPFEVGEGSLEGGGDFGSMDFATKIYLTSLIDVGTLSCDENAPAKTDNRTELVYSDDSSAPAASCQITRTQHPAGATCDLVNYRLETFTAKSLCQLDKTGWVTSDGQQSENQNQQLAGSMRVTFNPENRTDWGINQSYMTFTQKDGSQSPKLLLNRCGGTADGTAEAITAEVFSGTGLLGHIETVQNPDYDPSKSTSTSTSNPMTLDQFVAGGGDDPLTLSDSNDADPIPNDLIDWACVLSNEEMYDGNGKMTVTQTILFWGDALFGRF
jgi:hypothetical protein